MELSIEPHKTHCLECLPFRSIARIPSVCATMIRSAWIYACIGVAALCTTSCEAFSPSVSLSSGIKSESLTKTALFLLRGKSSGDDDGTAWIKDAMGSDDGSDDGDKTPPSNGSSEFTQQDVHEMEQLILSLSKVSDDSKRRAALAVIFDNELDASSDESGDDSVGAVLDSEIPRFAKLFQIGLDNVGESVQAAAREAAMKLQEESNGEAAEGEVRTKTPQELQLWALIDMMVQSKTRVKLYMGSMGSKGEFR